MALYKLNHGSKHEQNHRKYNQNPPDPHPNVPSWISTRGRSLCCPVSPSRHGYFLFVFNNHDKEKRELNSKTGRNSTFSCHSETNNTLRLSASRCKKKKRTRCESAMQPIQTLRLGQMRKRFTHA